MEVKPCGCDSLPKAACSEARSRPVRCSSSRCLAPTVCARTTIVETRRTRRRLAPPCPVGRFCSSGFDRVRQPTPPPGEYSSFRLNLRRVAFATRRRAWFEMGIPPLPSLPSSGSSGLSPGSEAEEASSVPNVATGPFHAARKLKSRSRTPRPPGPRRSTKRARPPEPASKERPSARTCVI